MIDSNLPAGQLYRGLSLGKCICPDMDRAWCVPLLASISTFLLTMPFTCFGLLFVLIMDKFGTTREQASWVESVFIMSSNLSALGIAFLQRRISLSNIAVMAAALTSAAVVASAFAPQRGMDERNFRGRLCRSSVYVVTFALSSISLAVLPHVMDITGLSVVLAIHGVAMGFIRCVKCVVIADQVGTERTAACWGISGLAIIPLSLANPTIIGFFRDEGGSYDNFYRMLSGINLFVTVQFAFFLVCRKARKSAIEDKHN
ncbi:hypothetical protein MTO96_025450 [Rhipicephalus appendiculatus]